MFRHLTLAEREHLLRLAVPSFLKNESTALPTITRAERGERLPLSFAQQRLWFLSQLEGASAAYHVPVRWRLCGQLDSAVLRKALEGVVARHEALRTTFSQVDGEPVQRIIPAEDSRLELIEHDLRQHPDAEGELQRLSIEEAGNGFDLEAGPLIRGRLIRLREEEHALLITMHHIVSDGWSMGVLLKELSTLYGAFMRGESNPLPELSLQYVDYAVWQRKWIEGGVLREQGEYWKTRLEGAPALLELPTDHGRPAQQDYAGGFASLVLDESLTADLKKIGKRHGTTLYMTLLAGWAALMARLSGQQDVVIGTPVANRSRVEIEGLIGCFVNTLALRVDVSGSPVVGELLKRVRVETLAAQEQQDIPFEQVVEIVRPVRSLSQSPVFQAMFTWQNAPEGTLEIPGVAVQSLLRVPAVAAKFDIRLWLREAGEKIVGGVEYATTLFEQRTIERYMGYYRRLLEGMVADDAEVMDRLPMMSERERRQILYEWNDTQVEFPSDKCVQELFEEQVQKTPEAVAVVFEEASLSYGELNRRANQLAHHLRALGVKPDERVAICVERSLEMVVGLLGILKAGGAYVPLDPAYPGERLRYMLEDSEPVALLTQTHLEGLFPGVSETLPVLDLAAEALPWREQPESNLDTASLGLTAMHLAYVIYTSGSTGAPKGVAVEHRNITRLFAATAEWFHFGGDDVWPLFHSFTFDFSVWELWGALLCGGRLIVVPKDVARSTEDFYRLLCRANVTILNQTPSAFRQLVAVQTGDGQSHRLRHVIFGGEILEVSTLRPWYEHSRNQGTQLNNMYGITETSVHVTRRPLERADVETRGSSPIGYRIPDLRIYILDAQGEPVPVGVGGELYIGGAGVARGYLNRPELTAERFLRDPFATEAGARMYKTGDLGRWLADGNIEFLGRNDLQVKIRGYRIELGEIEAVLAQHAAVRDAVVVAREDPGGDKRLVAYYTCAEAGEQNERAWGAEQLRAHILAKLPEYMVPAAYVRLESLPLTPNGKLDRKALPAPEADAYVVRGYEAPEGEIETVLAGIWAEVLKLERVGRHDNFFELGGHSLLAVQVVTRMRQGLGLEVAIRDLFARPILADLAGGLEITARATLPTITRAERGERLPLSFAQQRLWFLSQLEGASAAYHVPVRWRLCGQLDSAVLRKALEGVVARHEALRTTFSQVDGEPVQRIIPAEDSRLELIEHDLRQHPDAEGELQRLSIEEAGNGFDLEAGPLIRGRLIRLREEEHALLITMHHIVSDGWSMGVLLKELSTLYGAFMRGESNPLPELSLQYVDYAVWQRKWIEGGVLREQGEYWKTRLEGAPALLELPTDHGRPAQQDYAGGFASLVLDESLTADLKKIGKRHGTTLYMTLLAGWAALMARLSGQQDVVIGTPVANRSRVEIEGLIGCFVNTLALRVDVSGSPVVGELLKRVRVETLAAQEQQDIPFEQVVEIVRPVRSLSQSPVFQAMFTWQNTPGGTLQIPDVEIKPLRLPHVVAKFDLSLSLQEAGEKIVGGVEYATTLFEQRTIERYMGYYRRLLEGMVADDAEVMDRLPMMSERERRQILYEWNDTQVEFPSDKCVQELFEEQVQKTPEAVAVVFEEASLSYGELNRRANQLAHHLRALGVKPDERVAICVERSLEMVVGLLGILKAGGAYVPLDPAYPGERLRYMLEDSEPVALLTQTHLEGLFPGVSETLPVLDLAAEALPWREQPESNLDTASLGLTAMHLAYVIYTSGSTGAPKGVMVAHRGVCNYLQWAAKMLWTGGWRNCSQSSSLV